MIMSVAIESLRGRLVPSILTNQDLAMQWIHDWTYESSFFLFPFFFEGNMRSFSKGVVSNLELLKTRYILLFFFLM